MKKALLPILFLALACGDGTPLQPDDQLSITLERPTLPAVTAQERGGAWVYNRGEGQPGPSGATCHFGSYSTHQMTVIHTPSGRVNVKCHFEGLPQIPKAQTMSGWLCSWWIGGILHPTTDSQWTRSPAGQATVTCKFETEVPPPPKG